jgi:hypothetical protein
MIKIAVQIKGLDQLTKAFERLEKKALPAAARETLTNVAFEGRRTWQKHLEDTNTIRNKFTLSRVLVDPARGTKVRGMVARLGHVSQYVADLEEGHGETATGSAVPIPELAARGGSRDKVIGKPNKLATIGRLSKVRSKGKTFKARNAATLQRAKKTGKKLVLLEGPKSHGIFRVISRKKVKKVWDLSHRQVKRPKRPTLQQTVNEVALKGPAIALKALQKQFAKETA